MVKPYGTRPKEEIVQQNGGERECGYGGGVDPVQVGRRNEESGGWQVT